MFTKPVIGVDVGGTSIGIGRIDSKNIIDQHTNDITASGTVEQTVSEIIESIEKVYDSDVAGIGVGVPSLVDRETGIVYNVQNIPSWKEVHLKDILEDHFQKPVYLNNDANCYAIGEKYFYKGRKFRNMVGITLGTGMGVGIIVNHRLYSGKYCGAGEFGSIPYLDKTLEHYCSGQYFVSEHQISGLEMYNKAKKSDKNALSVFNTFGKHLGEAIKIILFSLSPEAIFLGGSVCRSFKFFEDSMWDTIKTFPYTKTVESLIIETTDHPYIAILGAAALCLEEQGVAIEEIFQFD
ncbi:Glucokinase [subsurface metagenome]